MTAQLVIGHGNGHNEPSLVDYVRDADADSFGCNEAQRLIGDLDAIPGHRVAVAGGDYREDKDPSGPRNRHRSTCIVTRTKRTNIGTLDRQVSERIPGVSRVAPDRVLVAAMFRHPLATELGYEGVAHFELHPDAAVRGKPAGHPLVREYLESLDSARVWMRAARYDRLLLVLTMDAQLEEDEPWGGPTQRIARPLHLTQRKAGIDRIMVDQALRFAGPLKVRKLHDHIGFVARLEAAKR